jgi:hypothetical protein
VELAAIMCARVKWERQGEVVERGTPVMWVKLGSEYINLNHLIRVRFIKTWNKEGD